MVSQRTLCINHPWSSVQCAVCSVQCAMFSVQYREIVQYTKGAEQIGQGKLGQAWHDKAG